MITSNYTKERLQEDLETMVLAMILHDPNTMAPETRRVMKTWAPAIQVQYNMVGNFEHGEW
jgi:hypothetical protein